MPVEVASAVINIIPSMRGLQSLIDRELRGVNTDRAGRDAGDSYSSGFGASAKKLTAVISAGFAAVKIGDFAKSAITQASDLNEVATKMQVVFGDANGAVQLFASQGAKALGLSSLEAQNAAATFGVFGKSAGLAGQDQADFSTGMAKLAVDMASFSNTTPEQAIEALSSGLRGEAEPLRQYGVLLDDASLRQEALSMGLITTTKDALTPQQKVLASHSLILKQTSDAQGDFERTSGGLANQQRILAAQWSDMKGKLGQAFLPVVTATVTALNDHLFPVLDGLGTKGKDAWAVLSTGDFKGGTSLGEEDSPLVVALFGARDAFFTVQGVVKEAWSILSGQGFTGGNGLEEDSPLVDLMFKVRDFGLDTFDKLRGIWDTLWDTAEKLWGPIKDIATSLFDAFDSVRSLTGGMSPLEALWDGLLWAFQKVADLLDATLVPAFTWLGNFMKDNQPVVLTLVGAFALWRTAVMALAAWQGILAAKTAIVTAATWLWNAAMDANPIGLVVIALVALAAGLVWAYNNVDWFREIVDKAWSFIKDATSALWDNVLKPALQWIGDNIHVVGDFFVAMWEAAQPIFNFLKNSFENFLTVVQGVIDFVVGVFTGDWSRAWDGIKGIFSGIWSQVMNIISTAWDLVTGIGGKILEWLGAFAGWAWDKIVALASQVVEWGSTFLSWLWDGIKNMAVNVFGWFTSLPGWIWEKVLAFLGWLTERGGEFLGWLWQGIKNTAVNLFGWFTALPGEIWNRIVAFASWVTDRGGEFIGWIKNGIVAGAQGIWDFITGLPGKILELLGTVKDAVLGLGKTIIDWIVDGIRSVASAIWNAITAALTGDATAGVSVPGVNSSSPSRLGKATGGLVARASGGITDFLGAENKYGRQWVRPVGQVSGPGGPMSDLIPTWLSDTEYVNRASSVQKFGVGTFDALNRGDAQSAALSLLPHLATGGMAGTKERAIALGGELAWDQAKQLIEANKTLGAAPAGARGAFLKAVASQMGLPYVWGGASPPSFDCSGLMSWALTQAGVGKGRLTAAAFGDTFPRVSSPKPGDMAIFDTGRVSPKAGHIGAVLDPAAGTMMHTDGAGPSRTSDYLHRSGLMGFIDAIGGTYTPPTAGNANVADLLGAARKKLGIPLNNSVGKSLDGPPPSTSGGVAMWHNIVLQALGITGQPAAFSSYVERQMQTESSGNVGAINLTDSNARKGIPSKGLMQVIDPTFRSYALAPYNQNIYDPLSNIIASIRYVLARYGSIPAGMRGVAYDAGGWLLPGAQGVNLGPRPEAVLTPPQSDALITHAQSLEAGFSGRTPNIEVNNYMDWANQDVRTEVIVDGKLVELGRTINRMRVQTV